MQAADANLLKYRQFGGQKKTGELTLQALRVLHRDLSC